MPDTHATLPSAARETRRLIRAGLLDGHTSGQAKGHVQGVAVVSGAHAAGFELYNRRTAQACPMLAMSQSGDPHLSKLGAGLDMCTGLPYAAALPSAAA